MLRAGSTAIHVVSARADLHLQPRELLNYLTSAVASALLVPHAPLTDPPQSALVHPVCHPAEQVRTSPLLFVPTAAGHTFAHDGAATFPGALLYGLYSLYEYEAAMGNMDTGSHRFQQS
ncbi:hypothetical protein CFE70_007209 [Pyrenophora teres f. teres 0-1]